MERINSSIAHLEAKKKQAANLCNEIYKNKKKDETPVRWYRVQKISLVIMSKLKKMYNEKSNLQKKTNINVYEREYKRAVKENNITSSTHERWRKRISKEVENFISR